MTESAHQPFSNGIGGVSYIAEHLLSAAQCSAHSISKVACRLVPVGAKARASYVYWPRSYSIVTAPYKRMLYQFQTHCSDAHLFRPISFQVHVHERVVARSPVKSGVTLRLLRTHQVSTRPSPSFNFHRRRRRNRLRFCTQPLVLLNVAPVRLPPASCIRK